MEHVTTVGSGAALVAPWWLPAVQTGYAIADVAHTTAVWATPFAGLVWIGVQVYYKIRKGK